MASSNGLLRMFGEEGLRKFSTDPVMIPYLSDPLFIDMINDISVNPQNIVKYQNEPKLQTALMIILPMMLSSCPLPTPSNPAGPVPEPIKDAETEKELGNVAFREQRYLEALKHYNNAISIDPNSIIYYSNKASALNKLGRWEDAMEASLLAVQIGQANNATNEQIAKAYFKLAQAALGDGKERGAYTALQESLQYHQDPAVQRMFDNLKKKLDIKEC